MFPARASYFTNSSPSPARSSYLATSSIPCFFPARIPAGSPLMLAALRGAGSVPDRCGARNGCSAAGDVTTGQRHGGQRGGWQRGRWRGASWQGPARSWRTIGRGAGVGVAVEAGGAQRRGGQRSGGSGGDDSVGEGAWCGRWWEGEGAAARAAAGLGQGGRRTVVRGRVITHLILIRLN